MDWILDAIIDEIDAHLKLYSRVKVGALPQCGGIAMYIGSGAPNAKYMDRSTLNTIYATVNAKHTEQRKAAAALEQIHTHLNRLKDYPSGTRNGLSWQITDITTSSAPSLIGQECDRQYLYGSIIQIKYYFGGQYGK